MLTLLYSAEIAWRGGRLSCPEDPISRPIVILWSAMGVDDCLYDNVSTLKPILCAALALRRRKILGLARRPSPQAWSTRVDVRFTSA